MKELLGGEVKIGGKEGEITNILSKLSSKAATIDVIVLPPPHLVS